MRSPSSVRSGLPSPAHRRAGSGSYGLLIDDDRDGQTGQGIDQTGQGIDVGAGRGVEDALDEGSVCRIELTRRLGGDGVVDEGKTSLSRRPRSTVNLYLGMSTSAFLRLFSRAPRTLMRLSLLGRWKIHAHPGLRWMRDSTWLWRNPSQHPAPRRAVTSSTRVARMPWLGRRPQRLLSPCQRPL